MAFFITKFVFFQTYNVVVNSTALLFLAAILTALTTVHWPLRAMQLPREGKIVNASILRLASKCPPSLPSYQTFFGSLALPRQLRLRSADATINAALALTPRQPRTYRLTCFVKFCAPQSVLVFIAFSLEETVPSLAPSGSTVTITSYTQGSEQRRTRSDTTRNHDVRCTMLCTTTRTTNSVDSFHFWGNTRLTDTSGSTVTFAADLWSTYIESKERHQSSVNMLATVTAKSISNFHTIGN